MQGLLARVVPRLFPLSPSLTRPLQEEGYEKALACNGEQCDGQTLKVMKCRPSPKERAAMQAARQAAGGGQQAPQQQQQAAAPPPQRYAPPARYEAPEPQAEAAPRQQWEERERAPRAAGGGGEGGEGGRRQHSGPAPKTPGYHVAYVGEP